MVGLLVSAIIALWAYHIYWMNKKEDINQKLMVYLKEAREGNEKTLLKVIDVVEDNTKAHVELRSSVDANTKATEALPETMTNYLIRAINGNRSNPDN